MNLKYRFPMYERLSPRLPWRGGRITEIDLLTLSEAAREASKHAGIEVTPADFLRAAARGEITLRAIVHVRARVQKHDGGIYCNQGQPDENTVPKGAILTLPLAACRQLANAGRASWRTFEGFERIEDVLCRFDVAWLAADEPDFETLADDCRVIGFDVHSLADAYVETKEAADLPSAEPSPHAPEDTPQEKAGSDTEPMQAMPKPKRMTQAGRVKECLAECERRAEEKRLTFDRWNMPGIKSDFLDLLHNLDGKLKSIKTVDSLERYLNGVCAWPLDAASKPCATLLYAQLFPELKWAPRAVFKKTAQQRKS